MPGYDGTGPRGTGAMTGGGRGYCVIPVGGSNGNMPTGRFPRRGGARGWRNQYYATGMPGWQRSAAVSAEDKEALRFQEDALKRELSEIQKRISMLENNK